MTCAPSATPNGGGVVAGNIGRDSGRRPPALRRDLVSWPDTCDTNRPSPTYSQLGWNVTLSGRRASARAARARSRPDLRRGRPLVQTRLGPSCWMRPPPSSVERRRRTRKPGEAGRTGTRQPMPARRCTAVHQRDADVRVVDQRVGERHPGRARADHQVVGLDHAHRAHCGPGPVDASTTGRTAGKSGDPRPAVRLTFGPMLVTFTKADTKRYAVAIEREHGPALVPRYCARLRRPDAARRRALLGRGAVPDRARRVGAAGPRAEAASSRPLRRTTPSATSAVHSGSRRPGAPTWRAPSGSSGSR